MPFFKNLTNNSLEYRLDQWRMQHFGLSGFDYLFSTNQGTDEGVSTLVGNVLSVKQRRRILAKGGLIGPLVNRLFCGTDHGIHSRKILKKYISFIVMRLRILHKCPREPSLTRLITYPSTDGFVSDFAVDPKTGNVAVATEKFIEVLNSNSGGRMFHSKTSHSSFSNRVAFGGGN